MHVTFACHHCHQTQRLETSTDAEQLACPGCGQRFVVPPDAFEGPTLQRCLVCPSTDLFLRKDFPQRLGVAIVVVGFIGSSIAWGYYYQYLSFAILFAVALIDVLLYAVVGEALMCYRCGAMYRGVPGQEQHGHFDLTVHEKHRQQAARLAQHRPAATVTSDSHR